MRDIAYDWNDAVHVISGAEVVSGQAIGSLVTMLPDRRTVKERLLDTMARAAFRPSPTHPTTHPVLLHVERRCTEVKCEEATSHNIFDLRDFSNKMRGGRTYLCRSCVNYVHGSRRELKRKRRKHSRPADAHAPVDVMSK